MTVQGWLSSLVGLALGGLVLGGLTLGCERKAAPHDTTEGAEAPAPPAGALPPLELRDDTPGTLLTWVDGEGEFHVAKRADEIPEAARQRVRVVVQGKVAGSPESVYVADLSEKQPDGRYAVRTMPRAEWDALGADQRKARLEQLVPPVQEPAEGAAAGVVIYGADWCKPCHQAEAYLRERKVPVVLKDIERDPAAHSEMKGKLAAANLRDASIPVIDVAGTLLVGFSTRALDAALKKLPPAPADASRN